MARSRAPAESCRAATPCILRRCLCSPGSFATFGQNERSLFGFAASEEPNGLRAFASATPATGALYGIQHFFDYVSTSFGHRLTSRAGTGDWERIRAVIDKAIDTDPVETAILKIVGILNLIDAADLIATEESLLACLHPAFEPEMVVAAVDRLRRSGSLFQRAGRSDLRMWTSRRVDLSTVWADSEREVPARLVSDELARHLTALPVRDHVLARRHSVITGTCRRFQIRLVHVGALANAEPEGGADGSIIGVFCGDQDELDIARAWAIEITTDDPTAVALVVPPMPELGSRMLDLLRFRWVVANAAALQEDAHAMAEVERGIVDLEMGLTASVEAALGLVGHAPDPSVEVIEASRRISIGDPLHFLVSTICDRVYDEAPLVENELVNRHALTSAGAGARQRLIEAMFAHAHEPDLGFDPSKNPPERALYLSMLRRGQVHRIDGESWSLSTPKEGQDPLRLRPALYAIEHKLTTANGRVPLPDVYALLERRPRGVRQGLAPLLLAVVLVANRHRVALFERGTYCPKLDGPAFMRILKSPEHFALQWVSLEGVRAEVFRRLTNLLDRTCADDGLMAVVNPLMRFAADLPFHVQRSTTLGPAATAVRNALASTRSPVDLVFRDLPEACGCAPFDPDISAEENKRAGEFVSRLEEAISEIRGCYPALLDDMRKDVVESLQGTNRSELQDRAKSLTFRIREQALRTFALRLSDEKLGDDAWIEALGGAVLAKPPSRWLTQDVALWRSRLDELAAQFLRVEAAAFGSGGSDRAAVRLSLTHVDGRERAVVVGLDRVDEEELVLARSVARLAEKNGMPMDKMIALLSLHIMEQSATSSTEQPTPAQSQRNA